MKKSTTALLSGIIGAFTGAIAGIAAIEKTTGERLGKVQMMSDKHLALFFMMNQWVKIKQEEKNLADYFKKKGYRKIAVYGMSYVGETLLDELKGTGVEVSYGVDKNADGVYADIDIVHADDELGQVDAVVVTAISFFDEIEEALSQKMDCPIVSLEDILYEL